jgi:hypothetical protein
MGTCYKVGSVYFRSIGQNILIASSKYQYKDGRFGVNSPSTGERTRNIASADPLATAYDFYNKIAFGGKEIVMKNGSLRITHMSDGTIITMRTSSYSDGTPAVQINITNSTHSGGVKEQKIHFILEEKP